MSRKRGKVDELLAVPALRQLRRQELEFLATQMDEIHFKPGQPLKLAGQPCNELLIVMEGQVAEGNSRTLYRGEVLGLDQMWERCPERCSVRALSSGRAFVMGHAQFRAWKALVGTRVQPADECVDARKLLLVRPPNVPGF